MMLHNERSRLGAASSFRGSRAARCAVLGGALACAWLGVATSTSAQNLFVAPLPRAAPQPPAAPAPTPQNSPGAPAQSPGGTPIPGQPGGPTPSSTPNGTNGAPAPSGTSEGAAATESATALPAPGATPAAAGPMSLESVSLMVVVPPKPMKHQKHDKIEIIVNETSLSKFEGKLDAKKQYDLRAELRQFPSLAGLFNELELVNGIGGDTPRVGLGGSNDFKGSGTYERKDRLTARISGLVLDVKPNGHLVVEAKEELTSDEETKIMVISGIVDPKDVTRQGTVQSSQLANLVLRVRHEGQVKDSSEKGLIPRVFEKLFNF